MTAMTPKIAYRRELMTTVRPYIGGIVLAAVVIGILVGTILYVAFSTGGSEDLKPGVVNVSLVAVIPAIAGIRLAHQNFISDHRATIGALRNLGVTGAFFRRHIVAQGFVLGLVGCLSAVILGRLLAGPLFSFILLGMNKELPDQWGDRASVAWSSFVVMMILYLLGVATIRVEKVLEKESGEHASGQRHTTSLVSQAGWVVAGLNIVAGIWCMLATPPGPVVFLLVFSLPVLAASVAGPLARGLAFGVSRLLARVSGWSAAAVGIRSCEKVGTVSRVGLATALVAIPLAGFTGAQMSMWAANHVGAENFTDSPVVVSDDHRLLEPAQAEDLCHRLDNACVGVVYWQPSAVTETGETSAPKDEATDYSLAASAPEALDAIVARGASAGIDAEHVRPFYPSYLVPFSGVSRGEPVNPEWALVAVNDDGVAAGKGFRTEPAQEWAKRVDMQSQVMYGPYGDGTAGFIPIVAYTLMAICLVLIVSVIGKRAHMHQFFEPLWILGRTHNGLKTAEFFAVAFPYAIATLTALLAGAWYTLVVHVAGTGRPGISMPYLPPGLWVLFAVVFLVTSATAFLPAAEDSRDSAAA